MKLVATLTKDLTELKFYTPEEGKIQFAVKANGKRKYSCYSIEKLRTYYSQMIKEGFTPSV